jgi:hypothetical protein
VSAGGSNQRTMFRIARRDGDTLMTACVKSGIPLAEARLWDAEDRKNPPPPECFELLQPAGTSPAKPEEDEMARPKKAPQVEEVHAPDFALAVRIWRQDIKPALAKSGEFAQEQSTAYKEIKKRAYIQPQAAKLAFRLEGMEEAKRDDFLRSFNGLLKEMRIFMPVDLVDAAQGAGEIGADVVPSGERPRPKLVTIPAGPADDSDLNPPDEPAAEAGEPEQQAAE